MLKLFNHFVFFLSMFTTTYILKRVLALTCLHPLQMISQIENLNFLLIIRHIPIKIRWLSVLTDTVFYINVNVTIVNYTYIYKSFKYGYVSDNSERRDESGLDYFIINLFGFYSMWCCVYIIHKNLIIYRKKKNVYIF